MSLGPYTSEVLRIADELSEHLRAGVRTAAFRVLVRIGEDGLLAMGPEESEKAIKLLSQTPSQREKALSRLDDEAAATLVMRARYMGLCSYKALMYSERFAYIRGSSYRGAAEKGAREAMVADLNPKVSEVLQGWYGPDRDYGKEMGSLSGTALGSQHPRAR